MTLTQSTMDALARAGLDASYVEGVAHRAIVEDLAGGADVTSEATIPAEQSDSGDFVARADGVVAGLPVVAAVFDVVADARATLEYRVSDGARVAAGDVLLTVTGATRPMLTAERTALNLLCRLSGIATLTRAWVDALAGTDAVVRDTRKTTPTLRALEKYAVRCGGGENHRMALSDVALVKDNHVLAAGGVRAAFDAVRREYPGVPVEVECTTVDEVREAADAGADLILLDNMSLADMKAAAEVVHGRGGVRLEASGGLTLQSAREVAGTGVDYLAVGALTHSAPALDIGFDLRGSADAARD